MNFVLVEVLSLRILLGNSGDGGSEGDEHDGDIIIDSCDSGDFAGGFGGHDGLSVINDFSENFSIELLDAFIVSAVLRILYKGKWIGGPYTFKAPLQGFVLLLHFFTKSFKV